jgi:hypothetical protein
VVEDAEKSVGVDMEEEVIKTTSAEMDSEEARKCEIGGAKKKKQEKTLVLRAQPWRFFCLECKDHNHNPITMMV